jgi:threonine dehydratase
VLEVMHERISPALLLDEVEVRLQLETRGPQHSEQVLARLRERGYRVIE